MKKRFVAVFSTILFLALFAAQFVSADAGPHTAVRLEFYVTYNNTPIAENLDAKILVCGQGGNCSWKIDNSALCQNSSCSFGYYRIERVPRQMKLLINISGETFSSDVINFSWTESPLFYDVNIMPDDKVIITPSPEQENSNNLTLWMPFIGALLLTIAIELLVSIIFLKRWKIKAGKWRGPILTVAIADIISVPLVWIIFFCIVAVLAAFFQSWSLLIAIITAEAFAVVFEGYALFHFNKKILPLKKSFLLSIIMNLTSFIIGGAILTGLLSLI